MTTDLDIARLEEAIDRRKPREGYRFSPPLRAPQNPMAIVVMVDVEYETRGRVKAYATCSAYTDLAKLRGATDEFIDGIAKQMISDLKSEIDAFVSNHKAA